VKTKRGAVTDAPPKKISRHQATDQGQDSSPVACRAIGVSEYQGRVL
jgi:hypothetical protein